MKGNPESNVKVVYCILLQFLPFLDAYIIIAFNFFGTFLVSCHLAQIGALPPLISCSFIAWELGPWFPYRLFLGVISTSILDPCWL